MKEVLSNNTPDNALNIVLAGDFETPEQKALAKRGLLELEIQRKKEYYEQPTNWPLIKMADALNGIVIDNYKTNAEKNLVFDFASTMLGCFDLAIGGKSGLNQIGRTMMSQDFVVTHFDFTIDDIPLMLMQALRGKYGEIYGKLDQITLNSWIQQYRLEKIEAFEQMKIAENAAYKGGEDNTRQSKGGDESPAFMDKDDPRRVIKELRQENARLRKNQL